MRRVRIASSADVDVERQSDRVTGEVLDSVVRAGQPLVMVSAPPGAGKTWLIETLAAVLVHYGLRVAVVTPRVSQLDALVGRLLTSFPTLAPVQVLQSARRALPSCIEKHAGRVGVTFDAKLLSRGSGVVLATAAKFFSSMGALQGEFDVLICDEAWQLSYHALAPLLSAARQTVLIYDSGQLAPLIKAPTSRFEAAPLRVHRPGPETLLQQYPMATQLQLPYSRRLTQGVVDLVQPAFYPMLSFRAATKPPERRLALSGKSTGSAVDRTIDLLADGASIAALVLPGGSGGGGGVDEEMAQVEASLVRQLLDRKARWVGNRALEERDIGCINTRVNEGATLRKHLRNLGVSTNSVWTDSVEAWQGQERMAILMRHPASGVSKYSSFHLESGRACVMLTRSSLCTIVTYREGIMETLQEHSHDCSARELGQADTLYRGWEAHVAFLGALENSGQIIRM